MSEDVMDRLSSNQKRAVIELMRNPTVRAAAQAVGVTERTLHRWLEEPVFQAALREQEGVAIDSATRKLIQLQDSAVGVFVSILANKNANEWLRLRAATAVLDYMLKLRELRNVESRLAALEAHLGKMD